MIYLYFAIIATLCHVVSPLQCHWLKYRYDGHYYGKWWQTAPTAPTPVCQGQVCSVMFDDQRSYWSAKWPLGMRSCMTESEVQNYRTHYEQVPPNEEVPMGSATCLSFKERTDDFGREKNAQTLCFCRSDFCNDEGLGNLTMELHSRVGKYKIWKKTFQSHMTCLNGKMIYEDLVANQLPDKMDTCLGQWCLLQVYNKSQVPAPSESAHNVYATCTGDIGCQALDSTCKYHAPSAWWSDTRDVPLTAVVDQAFTSTESSVQCCCKSHKCTAQLVQEAGALYEQKVMSEYKQPVIQCPVNRFVYSGDAGFSAQLKNLFQIEGPPDPTTTCKGNWCYLEIRKEGENFMETWNCVYDKYRESVTEMIAGKSVCDRFRNKCSVDEENTTSRCCCDEDLCTDTVRNEARSQLDIEFVNWLKILIIILLAIFSFLIVFGLVFLVLYCCRRGKHRSYTPN